MTQSYLYRHRDGVTIHVRGHSHVVQTATAWKRNQRTMGIGNRTIWIGGLIDGPYNTPEKHIALAIRGDVHHVVMTPEQARQIGQILLDYADQHDRSEP